MKKLGLIVVFLFVAVVSAVASEYDISDIYEIVKPESGAKAIVGYDDVKDLKYILLPTKIDKGKYVVTVTKRGSNIYQIDGTDICIETRYCYQYATREEVVIIIDSTYGYTKGKIIF